MLEEPDHNFLSYISQNTLALLAFSSVLPESAPLKCTTLNLFAKQGNSFWNCRRYSVLNHFNVLKSARMSVPARVKNEVVTSASQVDHNPAIHSGEEARYWLHHRGRYMGH